MTGLPLLLPKAIFFDMDGTLTAPLLDFPRIKAEMGIGTKPILEALAAMDPVARTIAQAVLDRHERDAAAASTLNTGCKELLAWLEERRIGAAIITRNSRRNLKVVLERHGLAIRVLVAREDAPFKPSPEPLWLACRTLSVSPADVWMVGDGWHDIRAGNAAGIRTVWVSHGRSRDFSDEPSHVVIDLPELHRLLRGGKQFA